MSDTKHENYEILNLIGYGLAKFNMDFVKAFGFSTKSAFFQHFVQKNIAATTGVVKNRQDLFDPFFDNGRKGWWQKGTTYLHRKTFIDSLFGTLHATEFADVVKLYIRSKFEVTDELLTIGSPVLKSKFKQLQITGLEAELYFIHNYQEIDLFKEGLLEDARLFGDGYDFQIQIPSRYILAEVKGLRSVYGSIRLTKNEFLKAQEYQQDYSLVVVNNLNDVPKMTVIFDPISQLTLKEQVVTHQQITYHSESMNW